jgi:hypothetical protein
VDRCNFRSSKSIFSTGHGKEELMMRGCRRKLMIRAIRKILSHFRSSLGITTNHSAAYEPLQASVQGGLAEASIEPILMLAKS